MNEPQFGNRVRQLLDEGLRLDARTSARLRAAREQALERRKLEPGSGSVSAGGVLARFGGPAGFSLRLGIPLLLLVLGLASLYTAQQKQRRAEVVEIETQLLADELPIDAYLDKGFEAWLKKKPRR